MMIVKKAMNLQQMFNMQECEGLRSAPVRLDPIPTKKSYLQSAAAGIEDHQMKGDKVVTF